MSRNVWNRPFWSPMVDKGSHQTLWSPLSQISHDILGHDHLQWHPPLIRHFTKSWSCYRTEPYHRFWRYYLIPVGFHGAFDTIAASQQRTLTPPDTWSCPIHSWICNVYGSFEFRTSLGTSILPCNCCLHRHTFKYANKIEIVLPFNFLYLSKNNVSNL